MNRLEMCLLLLFLSSLPAFFLVLRAQSNHERASVRLYKPSVWFKMNMYRHLFAFSTIWISFHSIVVGVVWRHFLILQMHFCFHFFLLCFSERWSNACNLVSIREWNAHMNRKTSKGINNMRETKKDEDGKKRKRKSTTATSWTK